MMVPAVSFLVAGLILSYSLLRRATLINFIDYSHGHPIILKLCPERSYYSRIILMKLATYYSQNYTDTLGAGLMHYLHTPYKSVSLF